MKISKYIIYRSLICIVCILSITFLPVTADAVGSKIFRAGEKVVKKHLQNKKPSSKPENSNNLGHYSTSAIRPFYEKMKSREDERCDTKKELYLISAHQFIRLDHLQTPNLIKKT